MTPREALLVVSDLGEQPQRVAARRASWRVLEDRLQQRPRPRAVAGVDVVLGGAHPRARAAARELVGSERARLLEQLARGLPRAACAGGGGGLLELAGDSLVGARGRERAVAHALLGVGHQRGEAAMQRPPATAGRRGIDGGRVERMREHQAIARERAAAHSPPPRPARPRRRRARRARRSGATARRRPAACAARRLELPRPAPPPARAGCPEPAAARLPRAPVPVRARGRSRARTAGCRPPRCAIRSSVGRRKPWPSDDSISRRTASTPSGPSRTRASRSGPSARSRPSGSGPGIGARAVASTPTRRSSSRRTVKASARAVAASSHCTSSTATTTGAVLGDAHEQRAETDRRPRSGRAGRRCARAARARPRAPPLRAAHGAEGLVGDVRGEVAEPTNDSRASACSATQRRTLQPRASASASAARQTAVLPIPASPSISHPRGPSMSPPTNACAAVSSGSRPTSSSGAAA